MLIKRYRKKKTGSWGVVEKKSNRGLCLNYNHEFIELLELYVEEQKCSK